MPNNFYISFFLFIRLLLSFQPKSYAQSTNQSDDDHQILLGLKQHWGRNSPALSGWNASSAAHCNWGGVTCTNGVVTAITLSNQSFIKPIPASLCFLKDLAILDLSYNNFSTSFPIILYNCSNLNYLDLSNNLFVGNLPDDINRLSTQLEHLNLSGNSFTGSIPPSIGWFPGLKSLILDTNGFDGSYPAEGISNLTNLEILTLADNPFASAPVPWEFGKLIHLTVLWLSDMNITGEIPDSLSNLTDLKTLALSENRIQGIIPMWIWQLRKLQKLYMYGNSFIGETAANVTALNLVEIDVSANILTGTIPEDFGKLTSLTLLYLYYNQLHGPIPPTIGLLPNLADIRLFNNKLSGALPPELGKHSPLGNLEVSNNNLSGELPEGLCFNRKLHDIVVFNNSFSGKLPESLESCNTLDNLMMYNNHFSGEFSTSLWSVVTNKLSSVMIQNNNFSGTFPTQLPWNFTQLDISNNKFSGPVPTLAGKMKVFKAANNLLSGEIPWDLTGISQITDLDLSRNQITGSIPMTIGVLKGLHALNISGNQISGNIPAAFGFMSALTILDLSSNALSGEIPKDFNKLRLSFLNLSMNQLSGEIPTSLQIEAYDLHLNPGLCVSSNNSKHNFPICMARSNFSNDLSRRLVTLFSVLASIVFLSSAVAGFLVLRKQKHRQKPLPWKLTPFHALHFTEHGILSGLCEQNWIGSGRSGKVYHVHVADEAGAGTTVAVKKIWRLQSLDENLEKDFLAEVQILGEIRHTNIVKLMCCISSSEAKLLVYEFMENGSLDRWLHQRERIGAPAPLDWLTRLQISIDSARGLCYLHHGCSPAIVHRDVKSANILLDSEFRAKVTLGLLGFFSNLENQSQFLPWVELSATCLQYGYQKRVNEKVDVYSFGVVLLELTTGRVANGGGAEYCLAQWAWRQYQENGLSVKLLDEEIQDPVHNEDMMAVFTLAVICTGEQPSMRPSMKDVLHALLRFEHRSRAESLQDAISEETALLEP